MQRPKQQAIAFLLGAVLVGGVVGFSADRVFHREDSSVAAKRKAMYDDLDLQPTQRAAMDAVLDGRNCQYDKIFAPIRPTLDSLKTATREKLNTILSPKQRLKLEARRKDHDARDEAERKRIQAACHATR
jgi:Spy/CpxP family protein refolding chaperone